MRIPLESFILMSIVPARLNMPCNVIICWFTAPPTQAIAHNPLSRRLKAISNGKELPDTLNLSAFNGAAGTSVNGSFDNLSFTSAGSSIDDTTISGGAFSCRARVSPRPPPNSRTARARHLRINFFHLSNCNLGRQFCWITWAAVCITRQ